MSTEERTLYITGLEERVDKEILEELFDQVGPVESVSVIPGHTRYAFVQFSDEDSVPFAIKMMDGLKIYGVPITVRPRANTAQDYRYKLQQGEAQRRHSYAASRNNNDYVPDYHPNQRRSWGPSGQQQAQHVHPPRYNQAPSHRPMHTVIPHHDPLHNMETPRTSSRTVGGYYQQPHRNTSEGRRSHNYGNGYNNARR